jgi:integrase/recombinase XerD
VKRPKVESYEGKTSALSDAETRQLLKQPDGDRLRQLRDRALLSVLLRLKCKPHSSFLQFVSRRC